MKFPSLGMVNVVWNLQLITKNIIDIYLHLKHTATLTNYLLITPPTWASSQSLLPTSELAVYGHTPKIKYTKTTNNQKCDKINYTIAATATILLLLLRTH